MAPCNRARSGRRQLVEIAVEVRDKCRAMIAGAADAE
jgi:hypothetical protein